MKAILDKMEEIVVDEIKKRTGLRGSWSLMGISERKDFLNTLRFRFKNAMHSPAGGKGKSAGKEKQEEKPAGQVNLNVGGPNNSGGN